MILEKISSEELYLNYPAMTVVATRSLEDTNAGIYPCYYLKNGNYLLVSTSVAPLIKHTKVIELNPNFKPANYFTRANANNRILMLLSSPIPHVYRKKIREILARKLGLLIYEKRWYSSWETIDKRIFRIKAFTKVSPEGEEIILQPDMAIKDIELIIDKAASNLVSYIQAIERKYPDYKHIIMVGGKDSQLIALAPKLNSKNWIIFSSIPDYDVVKNWIEANNIDILELIKHDAINEETIEDTKTKIIVGDLYSDPKHIRFLPTLKKIATQYNYKCIFWAGTAADAIFAYHQEFPYESPVKYFNFLYSRVGFFQGNYHQVFKNFVGCPLLSPYHSFQIWKDLLIHLDTRIIKKGLDLRKEIGRRMSNKSIKWFDCNDKIPAYQYDYNLDTYQLYLDYLKKSISE